MHSRLTRKFWYQRSWKEEGIPEWGFLLSIKALYKIQLVFGKSKSFCLRKAQWKRVTGVTYFPMYLATIFI